MFVSLSDGFYIEIFAYWEWG